MGKIILEAIKKELKENPNSYYHAHFLQSVRDLIEDYYGISDDFVDQIIQEMFYV